ncbi:MAG: squalene/phytoene synthase family protein, partial [Planctomycetia bacterium]
ARWSDDIADEAADPREAAARLAEWRQGLDDCFAGRPTHPIYVALADTASVTGLTIEPFADLLDAFAEDLEFDAAGRTARYADRPALLDYCRRSADPVGRIVLALEGCREPELVAMSDAVCSGLQLVNFWQDLRRDRLTGRVYLPVEDMRRHGVNEAMLDDRRASPALVGLVQDEVAWARELFAAGRELADRGPPVLRPAIRMFLAGGLAVADAIERAGHDTLLRRPKVGALTKLWLAGRAWWDLRSAPAHPAGAAR